MARIELATTIRAPVERVFDLARSIDLHLASTAHTGEQAIAGVTNGLISAGQEVTWRARHFGVWQTLTSRITECDRPHHFRDVMVRGIFRRLEHDHDFTFAGESTVMRDLMEFSAPFGVLGRCAERMFLTRYLRRFLIARNDLIRRVAESEEWKKYLLAN